jgi:hypothetical protein
MQRVQQELSSLDHLMSASIHQHGRLAEIGTIFNLLHKKIGDVCP